MTEGGPGANDARTSEDRRASFPALEPGESGFWQPHAPEHEKAHPGPDFAYAPADVLRETQPAPAVGSIPDAGHSPTIAFDRPPDLTYGDAPSSYPGWGGGPAGPWAPPDPAYRAPDGSWPAAPPAPRRRGVWLAFGLVVLALIGGLTAILLIATDSTSTSADRGTAPVPAPTLAPSTAPSLPSSPPSGGGSTPTSPLPSLGLVQTPPRLLAIGYQAYKLQLLAPADVAIGPAEEVQFRKYGLSRIVGLEALTPGSVGAGHAYDATINILRFRDAAGAQAELDYSNAQNKKTAPTVPLPGFPNATAFLNKGDAANGDSIGAFITTGRYQVVVILGGLSPNATTDDTALAAETAKVLRAVLPDAPNIVPDQAGGGGGGPTDPTFPTPTPSGTHA